MKLETLRSRMKYQGRRLHVLRIFQRRGVPILVEVVEQKSPEVVLMPVGAVARAIVADEVGDAAQRHGSLEPRGVSQNPVRHVTAIAAAGHAETFGVDPGVLFEGRI